MGTLLIFGALSVLGSWWWNASIDVEGVDVRTRWTVVDDEEGADQYHALIGVGVPQEARAEIVTQAENEKVRLVHTSHLDCAGRGIETLVVYRVSPLEGAIGTQVEVEVTADRDVIGRGSGGLDQYIRVRTLIPHATCSGAGALSHD